METINLNDILKIPNLKNVKIQFMFSGDKNKRPLEKVESYKCLDDSELAKELDIWFGWNAGGKRPFSKNQIGIGLLDLHDNNKFLLVAAKKVLDEGKKDAKKNFYHYTTEDIEEYSKYLDRVIVKCRSKNLRNICQKASGLMEKLDLVEILPEHFREVNHKFPVYDKINVSWKELKSVLKKENWITALQNQKGVYLITDIDKGKLYVGSAYGENMILGRWQSYVSSHHGGNADFKKLTTKHIENNFRYSVLDIFKSSTDDQIIIERESWWKNILQSKEFGYNKN